MCLIKNYNKCFVCLFSPGASDNAYLLGDVERSKVRSFRAKLFAIFGILLTVMVAIAVYFIWTKAHEEPTEL